MTESAGRERRRLGPRGLTATAASGLLLIAAAAAATRRKSSPNPPGGPYPNTSSNNAADPAANGITAFFPMYNDEMTVERMVREVSGVLSELVPDYEVLVINDGSTDRTGEIADRLAAGDPRVRVVHHGTNRGYGGALKSGFQNACKGLVFYTDGDGQYDTGELGLLFARRFDADIVNGYKINREDHWVRIILGTSYNIIARFFFSIRISDVDCDFRLIRSEAVRDLELESESGAICLELVKKLQERGCSFVEVPVHHYARPSGKSQFFTFHNMVAMLRDLAALYYELVIRKALTRGGTA